MSLTGYGISIDLPPRWDGTIYRRAGGDPTMHAANFPLPPDDADFANLAIGDMPPSGVVLVLTEYDRSLAGAGLFAHAGMPLPVERRALRARAFTHLQPGRLGAQRFCTVSGRAFCLYVVVGTSPDPGTLLRRANAVLSTVRVESEARPGA